MKIGDLVQVKYEYKRHDDGHKSIISGGARGKIADNFWNGLSKRYVVQFENGYYSVYKKKYLVKL